MHQKFNCLHLTTKYLHFINIQLISQQNYFETGKNALFCYQKLGNIMQLTANNVIY